MPSLYSVYRPNKFSELVGQGHITKLLKAELAKNLTGHAYLFIGPRGTGKTTTARIFAKALNCTNLQDGEPCGTCPSCKAFEEGKFIDLIEIDAASNRGIDEIREIKERIEYNPSMGKQKVYIIDEVHMLTKEAFNALLKTLEEPPAYVTFILATTEPHKVPATIMSRCEKFEFRLGNQKDITAALKTIMDKEHIEVDKKGLDLLVTHSGGSYRDAISLLDTIIAATGDKALSYDEVQQALGLPDEAVIIDYVHALAENNLSTALTSLDTVFTRGTNIPQFTKSVILFLRDAMVAEDRKELDPIVASLSKNRLSEMIKVLLDAYTAQRYAFDHRLPLQVATVQLIPDTGKSEPVKKAPEPQPVKETATPLKVIEHVEKVEPEPVAKPEQEDKQVEVKPEVPKEEVKASVVSAPKKKLKKKAKKKAQEAVNKAVSLDEIITSWGAFVRDLQKEHKNLYTFLMGAMPSSAQFDEQMKITKVEIKVPYDFHKKQLESPKNQLILVDTAKKIFGSAIQLVCVICKNEIVFRNDVAGCADTTVVTPAPDTVKIEARPQESGLESAFDSVLGADVESLG